MSDKIFAVAPSNQITSNGFTLDKSESHHVVNVRRKTIGDTIWVLDGQSMAYEGVIEQTSPQVSGIIQSTHSGYGENPRDIHLALAILKRNALETAIEQAVELGVRSVTLLKTDRIVKKDVNLDRLRKIIIAASKQCGRSRFMDVKGPVEFSTFITEFNQQKFDGFACHWIGKQSVSQTMQVGEKPVFVIIGPEGDFSPREIKCLEENSIHFASLGPRRLRAETAVSAACSIMNDFNMGG